VELCDLAVVALLRTGRHSLPTHLQHRSFYSIRYSTLLHHRRAPSPSISISSLGSCHRSQSPASGPPHRMIAASTGSGDGEVDRRPSQTGTPLFHHPQCSEAVYISTSFASAAACGTSPCKRQYVVSGVLCTQTGVFVFFFAIRAVHE
jgi:hypothetical protein